MGRVVQGSMFGEPVERPALATVFAQVRYILEEYPECRGNVGLTVAKVWYEFYGLGELVETGNSKAVFAKLAGEDEGFVNYKTVERNIYRVAKKYNDLWSEEK